MGMRAIAASGAGLVLAGAISARSAPSIDIFGTDRDTGLVDFCKCQDSVAPGGLPMNVAIYVVLGGPAAGGISGAEFFVQERGPTDNDIKVFVPVAQGGLDWNVSVIPNPRAAATTGHPFLETGTPPTTEKRAAIAFAVDPNTGEGCQRGDADAPPGFVKLYDATISKATTGNPIPPDTYLGVGQGIPPGSPLFPCPLVTLCNGPSWTTVCVQGGQFLVNPMVRNCTTGITVSGGMPCPIAVEPRSWGSVKSLYRD